MDKLSIKRALFSVSNKDNIVELAKFLKNCGVEIISTGGTAKVLKDNGIDITPINEITGNPESFGGRMKTISFQIGSSLLYRRGHKTDEADAKQLSIEPIDLVVCNLYPFEEVAKKNVPEAELIENIDIGGPTMLRAAAKNFQGVAVLSHPDQYENFIAELKSNGSLSLDKRKEWALAAFTMTAHYDNAIANKLTLKFTETNDQKALSFKEIKSLRYGENPHQTASLNIISNTNGPSIATANIIQGKPLSYNNLLDADAAWKICSDAFHSVEFQNKTCVAVIKHLNPCGLAVTPELHRSLELAWAGDPVSAFGGIVCFSQTVTEGIAHFFRDKFIEILIAPAFDKKALEILSSKKNLRLLQTNLKEQGQKETVYRSIAGGMLTQVEDFGDHHEFQIVTKNQFSKEKIELARFGIQAGKHLKSNAIALVNTAGENEYWLTGAGMGQPNRLDALRLLAVPRLQLKKEVDINESVLISDAFFPFRDSIDAANEMGVKYIIQPGGSIRDKEVIDACDEFGLAMAFTGKRHFRH